MENLPKEIKIKIALELSPKDLIEMCLSSKEVFYKSLCGDDEFWRIKLFSDYPEVKAYYKNSNLKIKNPKNLYIRLFSSIAKNIEDKYKDMVKDHDRKTVFNFIYNLYNEIRKNVPFKNVKSLEDFINEYIKKTSFNKNLYPGWVFSDIFAILYHGPLSKYVNVDTYVFIDAKPQ